MDIPGRKCSIFPLEIEKPEYQDNLLTAKKTYRLRFLIHSDPLSARKTQATTDTGPDEAWIASGQN